MNNLHDYSLIRVAAVATELQIANVDFNLAAIKAAVITAAKEKTQIILFPELALSAYSCADLFTQSLLLDKSLSGLKELVEFSQNFTQVLIVGVPIFHNNSVYNCAAVIAEGKLYALVAKQNLPNYGEFYEQRWFRSGQDLINNEIDFFQQKVPLVSNILFRINQLDCTFAIEICEDLWTVNPPSGQLCLEGAQLIFNPSASNEIVGKAAYRRDLVKQQSARAICGYVYTSAGAGESSTDLVYSAHKLICENGLLLNEHRDFKFATSLIYADLDLDKINFQRRQNCSFRTNQANFPTLEINLSKVDSASSAQNIYRPIPPLPFVPAANENNLICQEIINLQVTSLARRLKQLNCQQVVVGVSGGLDSSLALLVIAETFKRFAFPSSGIHALTMPGFGTSARTFANARQLIKELQTQAIEIDICPAVTLHFQDIKHPENVYDICYENSQARERTQILMDYANLHAAIVVGTGNLTEAALGWSTFNGDQMSMYHLNIGIPKTLVRCLIEWFAKNNQSTNLNKILSDIIATPISPELLPKSADGTIIQHSEKSLGPYAIHDFILYHTMRNGYRPEKILFLAEKAFANQYPLAEITASMKIFYQRFFSQQFKRSSMPDGAKVGSVALSPRGDWRMPSDASSEMWLKNI